MRFIDGFRELIGFPTMVSMPKIGRGILNEEILKGTETGLLVNVNTKRELTILRRMFARNMRRQLLANLKEGLTSHVCPQ